MAAVGVGSIALLSCSSSSEDVEFKEKVVVNMLADPQPIQLTEAETVFANDNNQFTLNFLKTVNESDQSGKSFFYSPLSITCALGMVNDAATGQTEKELEQTLGFHEGGIQAVNDYCKKLIEGLPNVDKDVTLNIANAIFLNKGYTLKKQFEQDVEDYYDAKAEALDFASPNTLDHINDWCKDKTEGMIPSGTLLMRHQKQRDLHDQDKADHDPEIVFLVHTAPPCTILLTLRLTSDQLSELPNLGIFFLQLPLK